MLYGKYYKLLKLTSIENYMTKLLLVLYNQQRCFLGLDHVFLRSMLLIKIDNRILFCKILPPRGIY